MRIEADWLNAPGPRAVMQMLAGAGHQALFVGGTVRNALLGLPPGDIDIATDAVPDRVMQLAEAAGLRPVPTGVEHGTVTVVADHEGIEVTTFRRDVETDGRRAVVAFSTHVEDDAARRDFTMNALYATQSGEVIDPLGGGLADLGARRVRFVGEPEERIREDYLRILRFFRFHAYYGDPEGGLDPEGLAACAANSAGIETLSRERIGMELKKLLAAPDPAPSVAAMAQVGALARALPGADHRPLAPIVHLAHEAGLSPETIRRLAALGGDDPAGALKLSRHDAKRLAALREGAASGAGAAELGYRLGAEPGLSAVLLRAALTGAPPPPDAAAEAERGAAAKFPVKPADLMPALQGPELGARLKELEARWIASGFTLTRAELLG